MKPVFFTAFCSALILMVSACEPSDCPEGYESIPPWEEVDGEPTCVPIES